MRDAFAGGNKCVQESYTRVDDRDYSNCCGSGCKFDREDFWHLANTQELTLNIAIVLLSSRQSR